ncbi:hypothetical protein [Aureibacillus halotolerans]|uniref:Uncharacterized protein n=1 Tax=Aureibacillus halotolerans TaxID=1508390 RepID=A0A4R6U6P7_9BACI|nr:hypothetical protein [Aureibacillus halotolerans]TDQ40379.1 hypothetical protein EV213_10695 [Aureibacillus halotolerans]
MKKIKTNYILIMIIGLAFIGILSGCGFADANEDEVVHVKQQSYEDFDVGEIVENAIEDADEVLGKTTKPLHSPDEELRKWVIRLSMGQMMGQYSTIDEDDLLAEAKKAYDERKLTFQFAEDVYGVDVHDEERINAYIREEMAFITQGNEENEVITFTQKVADHLSLTFEEFMYDWEYDNFKNNYVWQQVMPELEKKYPRKKDEADYHTRLLNEYEREIQAYKKEKNL